MNCSVGAKLGANAAAVAQHIVNRDEIVFCNVERRTSKLLDANIALGARAAVKASCDLFQFDASAAIVPLISSTGHGHASMKRLHYQEGKFALGNILCAVIPYAPHLMSARFLF